MKTVDAVRGQWSKVFAAYGLPAINRMKHIDCPICGKSKKFRIDDKDGSGSFICVCLAGDGWKLLQETQGKDFKTLANEIDQIIGNTPEYEKQEATKNTKLDKALMMFRTGKRIEGTPIETYLQNRGIYTLPKGGTTTQNIYNSDTSRRYDSMFALASNEFGEAVYSHTTYLDGGKKADVPIVRKMQTLQEYTGSVSVKLFEAKSTLGVAEGIETALSCNQLYKLPVWSTLNATILKKFRAPSGVNSLIIFADNDSNGTGLAAAFECGNRNILCNNDVSNVSVRWPKCGDFNDLLNNPTEVFEWSLKGK